MKRREPKIHQYIAALAIATILFFGGLWFGSYLGAQKLDVIDGLQSELMLSTLGSELQYEILEKEPCNAINSSSIIQELFEIGSKLDFMESELGANDPNVVELKEYYHLLEIRHWLLLKQINAHCTQDSDLILYFYSNTGDCDKCSEQGTILTYIHRTNPDVSIYSFDVHIQNPALDTIKELYGIKSAPAIIINDEKLEGFISKEKLESILS